MKGERGNYSDARNGRLVEVVVDVDWKAELFLVSHDKVLMDPRVAVHSHRVWFASQMVMVLGIIDGGIRCDSLESFEILLL